MEQEAYYRAKRVAKAKKKLRSHAITTVTLVVFLMFINLFTGGSLWFHWPMLGLGIPLIIHALTVYAKEHLEQYEQKTLKKEMKKYGGDDEEFLELKDQENMDLDELPKLRKEWKDSDFV